MESENYLIQVGKISTFGLSTIYSFVVDHHKVFLLCKLSSENDRIGDEGIILIDLTAERRSLAMPGIRPSNHHLIGRPQVLYRPIDFPSTLTMELPSTLELP